MKNLIYQYWDGDLPPGAYYSKKLMKEYADLIGADYLFEHNPKFNTTVGNKPHFWGTLKPIYDDKFWKYDSVLYVDMDVYPVQDLQDNIFEYYKTSDMGICTERFQPENRARLKKHHIRKDMDEKWAKNVESFYGIKILRNRNGLIRVYNAGVVLFNKSGLEKAKLDFKDIKEYEKIARRNGVSHFYGHDQNYIMTMLQYSKMNYAEMDNAWNSLVHQYFKDEDKKWPLYLNDERTERSKFVHVQMRGADNFSDDTLYRITNKPPEEWGIDYGER